MGVQVTGITICKEGKVHQVIGYERNKTAILRFRLEIGDETRVCLQIGLSDAVPFETTC
jgi:hypothetical protein